ncbi:RNA-directed DNA polymerase [Serratia marcescens subsp. marcescens ATCC 13880]|nr:RNA-directed DNA polymerase [Serratia marcescens subsp. marcescens ATCC 13880]
MFANLWLSPLDHFIKHSLKARGYVRYMDDLFLLGSSSKKMSQWRELIASFCASELSLTLHPKKNKAFKNAVKVQIIWGIAFILIIST